MANITKKDFIEPLKHNLGMERSQSLFIEVVAEINLPEKEVYSAAEGKQIIEQLKAKGGLIRILAMNLAARLVLKGIIPP
jgi:hypothetical protein